jgi:hypothetical protein
MMGTEVRPLSIVLDPTTRMGQQSIRTPERGDALRRTVPNSLVSAKPTVESGTPSAGDQTAGGCVGLTSE